VLLVAALAAPAGARRGLTIGFNSQPVFTSGSDASRSLWLGRAAQEGAQIVRINVFWNQVAPSVRPAAFDPSNPSSRGYDWASVDTAVRDLTAGGMRVLITILAAPTWAEGAGMPASAPSGSWRPDPGQFAAFAKAAATRYSGHFPDPLNPESSLPRVSYWQPWNEPNLSNYITPQWIPAGRGFTAESPIIYRGLLNAFYRAVKAVSPANFVVTAGTAPYGDPPGGDRIPPVEFYRDLFCLKDNAGLTPLRCPTRPYLDAISHHPYGVGGPLWHARNHDDAAVPDVYKIANVLKAAERSRHVLPGGRKQIWDTEVSWDSRPPDPDGVPVNKQARWVEQTLYVLWRQGVNTILWLQLVDAPPVPNYATTSQGGTYYLHGQPKPAARALRFPFVTQRTGRRRVIAWGRAPKGGTVKIEVRHGKRWSTSRKVRVKPRRVFAVQLRIRGRFVARAQIGGEMSLTWTQSR
jgi:hypothetical protein